MFLAGVFHVPGSMTGEAKTADAGSSSGVGQYKQGEPSCCIWPLSSHSTLTVLYLLLLF